MAPARVALVTGAARGIGRAIAQHLQDEGWRIAALDLPKSGLARAFPPRRRNVLTIEADVADEVATRMAVKSVMDRFGRLDAVVSNAGIMVRKPLRQLTPAEWRKVIDTNLTATFLLARAAEKPLRAAKGAIVTLHRPAR
jgi:NAD(P)-dependent dehydrogenase (short-subunit alcohol dehydrogenase family)